MQARGMATARAVSVRRTGEILRFGRRLEPRGKDLEGLPCLRVLGVGRQRLAQSKGKGKGKGRGVASARHALDEVGKRAPPPPQFHRGPALVMAQPQTMQPPTKHPP